MQDRHEIMFSRCKVDYSDHSKTADAFLKICSVYKEEPEVKKAVLETTGKRATAVQQYLQDA